MALPLSPLNETIHKQTAKQMIRDKLVSMIASGHPAGRRKPGAIEKNLDDYRFIVRALRMRNPAAALSEHILCIRDTSREMAADPPRPAAARWPAAVGETTEIAR